MKVVQRLFLTGLMAVCLLSAAPVIAQSSCGDANGDGVINVGDAVYTINYIFRGGPAPLPNCCFECTSGQTRPCYSGPPVTEGVGLCHAGTQTCVDGAWGPCEGEVVPSVEVCDGQDNDCDGIDDNDVPGVGEYCYTGLQGVCAAGIRYCVAGMWWCEPNESPAEEVCDGLDNDCNGVTDDNIPGIGEPCNTGNIGPCAAGTMQCVSGVLQCVSTYTPVAEICDGIDNDCNGLEDEELSAPPCSMQDGVCSGSVMQCGGPDGWLECTPADYGPHYEINETTCDDGLDNDCDGVTDADDPDCQKKK
ncbi:MAG: hypothetical protein GYA46_11130 [candidate division Zixibacteria bacterium]|nr:hypothetical protein [candidate division Zixibacteria bacterium]